MKRKVIAVLLSVMIGSGISVPAYTAIAAPVTVEAADQSAVTDFVTRLYKNFLSRNPDAGGLSDWVSQLVSGSNDAAHVVYGFVYSNEFQNRPLDNNSYVTALYRIILGREPDAGGFSGWVSQLSSGASRQNILAGFTNSQEFQSICDAMGIRRGSLSAGSGSSSSSNSNSSGKSAAAEGPDTKNNPSVAAFVKRLYQYTLERQPDTAGFEDWVTKLVNHTVKGAEAARGFFYSQEFMNSGLSNNEFVNRAYLALLNRKPDAAGFADWTGRLAAGTDRSTIIEGFLNSTEFKKLCSDYLGETNSSGKSAAAEGPDTKNNPSVAAFVKRLYQYTLGRQPDTAGFEDWVTKLVNHTVKGAEAARGFFYSQEFMNSGLSNNEFVNRAYLALLNRKPDAAGFADWTGRLAAGTDRSTVIEGFLNSTEFKKLCSDYLGETFSDSSTGKKSSGSNVTDSSSNSSAADHSGIAYANMSASNYNVFMNVIAAVETGGMVYGGTRNYGIVIGPHLGAEVTATLGWCSCYGENGRRLLNLIYNADPAGFKAIDANGKIQAMLNTNWETARWAPTSEEISIMSRLISTETGKKMQDTMFHNMADLLLQNCAQKYTTDTKAQIMYAECAMLGGERAAIRIFDRCAGDYSLNSILASLWKDQDDTSNNWQIGDQVYVNRHNYIAGWLNQYIR